MLAMLAVAAGALSRPVLWQPNPGPQTAFLASSAYEVLYGGAAGGGKTSALVVGPLRFVGHPRFHAISFRRTFPELEKSLIEEARRIYPVVAPGAKYNDQKKAWRFPSGAVHYFGHMEHNDSVELYKSAEFQWIGFDQLEDFTEYQYTYMLSRARSSHGVPIRIRASANPGGIGQEWIMRRWAPWLDTRPGYSGPRARPGEILWYLNTRHGEEWVPPRTPGALSRTFIPARLRDNPKLMEADPDYEVRLLGLDPVSRARLLDGDWLVRPAAGAYFKRGWFEIVDAAPADARRVRYWDRAATEPHEGNRDPDWTVGVKLSRSTSGVFFVEDVVRLRGRPLLVRDTIRATAELDGRNVIVGIEQDPGQAGVVEAEDYVRLLAGFSVKLVKPTGDKLTRAGPAIAQAEARNIKLVRGQWNEAFVQTLEGFPEWPHDDDVDALSGAVAMLTANVAPPYRRPSGSVQRCM